jgi:uncharacterized protein YozE (UPF0346 family)
MNKILRYVFVALLAVVSNAVLADEAYKTLTFPDDNKANNAVGAYTEKWTATIGDFSWEITNFNNNKWNNWIYIKCGRKKVASTASIATSSAMDKAIGTVLVTIDNITAGNVNSISLEVATDAAFSDVKENVKAEKLEKGYMEFKVKAPAANLYYKLVFDCAAGSSNGLVQVSKVKYYEQGKTPTKVDISNSPETAYSVAKAKELIDANEGLATSVYVKGIVSKVDISGFKTNKNLNISISDDGEEETANPFEAYGCNDLDNKKFTSADAVQVGDKVIVYGNLTKYGSTYELGSGCYLYSINGKTTGISSVKASQKSSVLYNLSGQRVNGSYKGVVISNGKKYVNK